MDFYEYLYGEEFHKKDKEFTEALSQIEKKHIEFFKNRPPKFKSDEHDRLQNHWIMINDNQNVKFGFDNNSDIPEYIKVECLQAFKKIFSPNNK